MHFPISTVRKVSTSEPGWKSNPARLSNAHRAYFGSQKPFGLVLGGRVLYIISDPSDAREAFGNQKGLPFAPVFAGYVANVFELRKAVLPQIWIDVPGEGRLVENMHLFFKQHLTISHQLTPMTDSYLERLAAALDSRLAMAPCEVPMYEWVRYIVYEASIAAIWGPEFLAQHPEAFGTIQIFDEQVYTLGFGLGDDLKRKAREAREKVIASGASNYRLHVSAERPRAASVHSGAIGLQQSAYIIRPLDLASAKIKPLIYTFPYQNVFSLPAS